MSLVHRTPALPPDDVFAEFLRAARALLAVRRPLDAELVVSELLGAWWGGRLPGTDVDRVLGEGLIGYAATQATPAAAALLTGIAWLGPTRRQRIMATRSVLELARRDVPRPDWALLVGTARSGECYITTSRFGDTDDVVCTYTYDSAAEPERHAVIAVIDHNAGGILRDIWVTTKVDQLLARGEQDAESGSAVTFSPLPPPRARALMESAISRTDEALSSETHSQRVLAEAVREIAEGSSLASGQALLRARARILPAEGGRRSTNWRRDHRATLAARFLASEAAQELSDSFAASRCVDHIIDYGCDVDARRPLRVSPRKVETFLLDWLPRHVVLSPEEQEAMPHVLAAWIRWAGPLTGLPSPAVGSTLDALWEATRAFADSYQDPAGVHGLRPELVSRLLPDGDLSALPRRMFAFPLLTSELVGEERGYDPTTPEGRRALLRLDHFNGQQRSVGRHSSDTFEGSPELEEALDQHEKLAQRLWDGDPPDLWAAAQRLLDRGQDRMSVIEALLEALCAAEDTAGLVKRLNDL